LFLLGNEGGGCAGLHAELGEIPAASAGMTDLILREYDRSVNTP